jgi:uncharacterized membrane-anchored protein YjiN (DUF445 family)
VSHMLEIAWLKAFSEAAVIGGLADWFAVVALFRHPMGLPIPHTALISKNKNKIGKNLGLFVSEEFLTREKLEPKIDEVNIAEKASRWLSEKENAQKISNLIVEDVIPGILNVVNDDDVKRFIHDQFKGKMESIDFGELVGIGLGTLTKDGRHQALFTTILEKLHEELHSYNSHIRSSVSDETPWWSFGLADEKIANGITSGLDSFLKNAKHPSSDVRKKVDAYVYEYIEKLKTSPEMQENINNFISKLANNKDIQDYINGIWDEIKAWITKDLSRKEESKIKNGLTSMFQNLGHGLSQDKNLKDKINNFIKNNLLSKLIENRMLIGNFIASTVESWDSNEVSQKLELEIGKDLQFIRLNGTLVGGLIGIVLYAFSLFIG